MSVSGGRFSKQSLDSLPIFSYNLPIISKGGFHVLSILAIVLGVIIAAAVAIGILWLIGDELGIFPAVVVFLIICRAAVLLGGSLY